MQKLPDSWGKAGRPKSWDREKPPEPQIADKAERIKAAAVLPANTDIPLNREVKKAENGEKSIPAGAKPKEKAAAADGEIASHKAPRPKTGRKRPNKIILMSVIAAVLIASAAGAAALLLSHGDGGKADGKPDYEVSADETLSDEPAADVIVPDVPQHSEIETENPEPERSDMRIETEYYTLTVPDSWKENCFYEVYYGDNGDYTLKFWDRRSLENADGGWLFSIMLLTVYEDYTKYAAYDILGRVEVYQTGAFNAVVIYPTDVQYSQETAAGYGKMADMISEVLKSISFKENCIFSEEPLPVQSAEEQPGASEEETADGAYTVAVEPDTEIYKGPSYDSGIADIIGEAGVYTIVEERTDDYGNIWGRLKSGAGWIWLGEEPNVWCPNCGYEFFTTGVGADGLYCPECGFNWMP